MKIQKQAPFQVLNKSYARLPMSFAQMDNFKAGLALMFSRINEQESEENLKNIVADFLKNTFYSPDYEVNTKGRNDLVIHEGRSSADPVGVIIEAKKPSNRSEMISLEKPNSKALHELVLYYLREKIEANNHKIKYLIATDIWQWYFFDENWFEKNIFRNTQIRKDYQEWKISGKDTAHFYKHIAQPFLETLEELPCCLVNLLDYKDLVVRADTNNGEGDQTCKVLKTLQVSEEESESNPDRPLVLLYKLFSPEHLLKKPFANDANSLNTEFYFELLHILGLKEKMEDGVLKIKRKEPKERQEGSWLENTIRKIESTKRHETLSNLAEFGESLDDQLFSIGLELTITWLNRVLFLKLLEGQLIRYHRKDRKYAFLNIETLADFDELEELFFEVLAVPSEKRSASVKQKFGHLPYLNSALFEITELEQKLLTIGCLKDRLQLPLYQATVLKDEKGKQLKGEKPTLQYLFEFLDSFDFGSDSNDILQEKPKTMINASVLGKIFEKLNGYADGSVFTPHFITEYMCRETVRKAILQKFQKTKNLQGLQDLTGLATFEELKDFLQGAKKEVRQRANELINSIRICDPAVGSGHFLVSVLNELLLAKIELEILQYEDGSRIRDFEFSLVNEEVYFVDYETGEELNYEVPNELAIKNLKRKTKRQLLQETLFHEKQTLIENCLFGVDINPKSVMICRLRLWIELLKNAYYTFESGYRELQTLPNIDINIKIGNSLVSRFGLNGHRNLQGLKDLTGFGNAGLRNTIERYKLLVRTYKETRDTNTKTDLRRQIGLMKQEFEKFATPTDKDLREMRQKEAELAQVGLSFDGKYSDLKKLEKEINELHESYKQKLQTVYRRAFEWRFEFPEILDEEGNFEGFDAIVGNPPYISLSKMKGLGEYFGTQYETYSKSGDLYVLFYELARNIVKNEGFASYVTSNSWLRTQYGETLRRFFAEKVNPLLLVNLEDVKAFEAATVESNILLFEKKPFQNELVAATVRGITEKSILANMVEPKKFLMTELDPRGWVLGGQKVNDLKRKIEEGSVLLGSFELKIYRGITTGLNEAFVIDEETKNSLIREDQKSKELLKPILRGRDIQSYAYQFSNLYIINARKGIDIEAFSAVFNHLKKYETQLRKKTGGNEWYEFQANTSDEIENCFQQPKIVYGELSDKGKFAFDNNGFYMNNTVFMMTGENLKYLLAILNSKLAQWYFEQITTTSGTGTNRWLKYKIEQLPIKKISETEQQPFVELVDRILTFQKLETFGKFEDLLAQIDSLVYQLYGLTAEEIAEIEK